jgi:hypothetical protein
MKKVIFLVIIFVVLAMILVVAVIFFYKPKSNVDAIPTKLTAQLRYTSSSANNYKDRSAKVYEIIKGEVVNLRDEDNAQGYERYSFKIIDIKAGLIVLEQVSDELGNKNDNGENYQPDGRHINVNGDIELRIGQNLIVSPNVPGGGPQWTISIK